MIKGGIIQQVIPWDGVIAIPTDIQVRELVEVAIPTNIQVREIESSSDLINYDLTTQYDEQTSYS